MAKSRTKKLKLEQPKTSKRGKSSAPKKGAVGSKKIGAGSLKKGAKAGPQGKTLSRAVASLAEAIRALRTEDGSDSVDTRVTIGRHLVDARKMLPAGLWLQFLSEEVGYAFRTAQRLIQLNTWARQNRKILAQVRSWGPTKVYHVMDAGPEVAKQLLSRKRFVVGSGKRKSLAMLTGAELKGVLNVMAGAAAARRQPQKEALDEEAELLRLMQRDSRRLVHGVNRLAPLANTLDSDERQEVAQVYKRLLRCAKKLETVLYESG